LFGVEREESKREAIGDSVDLLAYIERA